MNEVDRKNHNRAITILIAGMIAAAFTMINAKEVLMPSVLYILLQVISIFLYFIWNRF